MNINPGNSTDFYNPQTWSDNNNQINRKEPILELQSIAEELQPEVDLKTDTNAFLQQESSDQQLDQIELQILEIKTYLKNISEEWKFTDYAVWKIQEIFFEILRYEKLDHYLKENPSQSESLCNFIFEIKQEFKTFNGEVHLHKHFEGICRLMCTHGTDAQLKQFVDLVFYRQSTSGRTDKFFQMQSTSSKEIIQIPKCLHSKNHEMKYYAYPNLIELFIKQLDNQKKRD